MNRERILNGIGIGLIAVCFLFSCIRVFFTSGTENDPNVTTIRFAHWQLEPGVRTALDAVSREYEKQCAAQGKKVHVEQLAIPDTVYANWFITQLVGGTAPDLLQLGKGDSDDRLARYFVPFTSALEKPNPYNKGTDLDGVRWRDTFTDGLQSLYSQTLLDYYEIPATVVTIRMFYNKDLYQQILGDTPVPKTYAQLHDLCVRVQDYARQRHLNMVPIVGSRYNSPYLAKILIASQTQREIENVSLQDNMLCNQEGAGLGYLRGDWSLSSPAMKSGLHLLQDVSSFMQPGYLQFERDDATFYFVQNQALMMCTGSWDAVGILKQAPFPVGVFKVPIPATDDPQYGKYVLGQQSEAGSGVSFTFGLCRDSKNRETALDFLRFLSSKRGAQIFTDTSGWLPATRNVEPPSDVKSFQPELDGYIQGFGLIVLDGGNTQRIYENNFYRLLNPDGITDFISGSEADYTQAVKDDIGLINKARITNLERSDSNLASIWRKSLEQPKDADAQRKLTELTELQTDLELSTALIRYTTSNYPAR